MLLLWFQLKILDAKSCCYSSEFERMFWEFKMYLMADKINSKICWMTLFFIHLSFCFKFSFVDYKSISQYHPKKEETFFHSLWVQTIINNFIQLSDREREKELKQTQSAHLHLRLSVCNTRECKIKSHSFTLLKIYIFHCCKIFSLSLTQTFCELIKKIW